MYKTGEAVGITFSVSDPDTKGLVDADTLPTGELRVNGEATADTVTITNKSTGKYKASVTLPTVADGDVLEIWVNATVGGVAGGGIVWRNEGVTKRPVDISVTVSSEGVNITSETL